MPRAIYGTSHFDGIWWKHVAINTGSTDIPDLIPLTQVYLLHHESIISPSKYVDQKSIDWNSFQAAIHSKVRKSRGKRFCFVFLPGLYFVQIFKIQSIISSSLVPETFTFSIRHAWTNRQNPSLFLWSAWRRAKRKRDISRYNSNSRALRKFCIKSDP